MDNPSCDTCRWLATITDLGSPGGARASTPEPAPVAEGLHADLFRRGWEAGYKSGESDTRRAYAAASPSPETAG